MEDKTSIIIIIFQNKHKVKIIKFHFLFIMNEDAPLEKKNCLTLFLKQ